MASYEELSKFLDDYNPQQQQLGVNSFDGNTPQQLTPYEQMMRDTYGTPEMQAQQQEQPGLLGGFVKGAAAQGLGVLGNQAEAVASFTGNETAGNIADAITDYSKQYARPKEYTAKDIFLNGLGGFANYATDPHGMAYDIGGGFGSTAALGAEAAIMAKALAAAGITGAATLGAGALSAVARRLGLSTVEKALATAGGRALIGNLMLQVPMESASEAGGTGATMTHDQQTGERLQNVDREAVREAMIKDFAGNMAVLGASNLVEGVGLGRLFGGAAKGIRGTLKKGAEFLATNAGQNAWEEGAQTGADLYARGEAQNISQIFNPFEWNQEQIDAAAIGGIAGLGQGGAMSGAGYALNRMLGQDPQQEQPPVPAEGTANNAGSTGGEPTAPPAAVPPKFTNEVTNSQFADAVNIAMNDTSANLVERMRHLQGHIAHRAKDGTNCARTVGLALAGTDYQDLINVDNFIEVAQNKGQLKDPANYVPKPGDLAVVNDGNHIVMVTENGGTIQNGRSADGVYESELSPQQMFGSVKYYISTSDNSMGQAAAQANNNMDAVAPQAGNVAESENNRNQVIDEAMEGKKAAAENAARPAEDVAAGQEQEPLRDGELTPEQYIQNNIPQIRPITTYRDAFAQEELEGLTPGQLKSLKNKFYKFKKNNPSRTLSETYNILRNKYNEITGKAPQPAQPQQPTQPAAQPAVAPAATPVTAPANATPINAQPQAAQNDIPLPPEAIGTGVEEPAVMDSSNASPMQQQMQAQAGTTQVEQFTPAAQQNQQQPAQQTQGKTKGNKYKNVIKLPETLTRLKKRADAGDVQAQNIVNGLKPEVKAALAEQERSETQNVPSELQVQGQNSAESAETLPVTGAESQEVERKGGAQNVLPQQKSPQLQKPETRESGNQNVNAEPGQGGKQENEGSKGSEDQNEAEVVKVNEKYRRNISHPATRIVHSYRKRIAGLPKTRYDEASRMVAEEAKRKLQAAVNIGQATQEEAQQASAAIEKAVEKREEDTNLTREERIANAPVGKTVIVRTDDGTKFRVRYKVVSANDVIASNVADGSFAKNKEYPQRLQPRNRESAVSQTAANKIAANLDPELLTENTAANMGAPIIDENGYVENGNLRMLGIMLAHAKDNTAIHNYEQYLADHAEDFGLTRSDVMSTNDPVLVRERVEDADGLLEKIIGSTSGGQHLNATEQAQQDAKALTPETLSKFNGNEKGELNKEFITAAINDIAKLSPNVQNELVDKSGNVSKIGIMRIKNALFAKAYGDPELLERAAEATTDNSKSVTNALLNIAPEVAKVKAAMDKGNLFNADFTKPMLEAANKTISMRNEGKGLQEVLQAIDIFGGETDISDGAKQMLQEMGESKGSTIGITRVFNDYLRSVKEQNNNEENIVGAEEVKTANTDKLVDHWILSRRGGDLFEVNNQGDAQVSADSLSEESILNEGKNLLSPETKKWIEEHKPAYDESLDDEGNNAACRKLSKEFQKVAGVEDSTVYNSKERNALRDKIRDYLYNVGIENRKRDRQATLIIGLSASGKSTISDSLLKDGGYLLVDADEAKKLLPEYNNGLLAGFVHEESSDINKELLNLAIINGDNVCLPTVGGGDGLFKKIKLLKAAGYRVKVSLAHVPVEEAKRRVIQRFKDEGRFVDTAIIDKNVLKAPEKYVKITTENGEHIEVEAEFPEGSDVSVIDTDIIRNYMVLKYTKGVDELEWINNNTDRNAPLKGRIKESLTPPVAFKRRHDGQGLRNSGGLREGVQESVSGEIQTESTQIGRTDTTNQGGSSVSESNSSFGVTEGMTGNDVMDDLTKLLGISPKKSAEKTQNKKANPKPSKKLSVHGANLWKNVYNVVKGFSTQEEFDSAKDYLHRMFASAERAGVKPAEITSIYNEMMRVIQENAQRKQNMKDAFFDGKGIIRDNLTTADRETVNKVIKGQAKQKKDAAKTGKKTVTEAKNTEFTGIDTTSSELERLKKELDKELFGKLNANPIFNPKIWSLSCKIGAIYIAKGTRNLRSWAEAMTDYLGEKIRPWLGAIWETLNGYNGSETMDLNTMTAIFEHVGKMQELHPGITKDDFYRLLAEHAGDEKAVRKFKPYIEAAFAGIDEFVAPGETTNVINKALGKEKEKGASNNERPDESVSQNADQNTTRTELPENAASEDAGRTDTEAVGTGSAEAERVDNGRNQNASEVRETAGERAGEDNRGLGADASEDVRAAGETGQAGSDSGSAVSSDGSENGSAGESVGRGQDTGVRGVSERESGDRENGTSVSGIRDGRGRNAERGERIVSEDGSYEILPSGDYHVIDAEKAEFGATAKEAFKRNALALSIIKRMREGDDSVEFTPEVKNALANFNGFGRFRNQLFNGTYEHMLPEKGWEKEAEQLKELMTKAEWEAAQNSTTTAFYTPYGVANAMWNLAKQLGLKHGNILEPSMGVGGFFATMPTDILENSTITGIDIDQNAAKISEALYPSVHVFNEGYEDHLVKNNSFDFIVTNVPYENMSMEETPEAKQFSNPSSVLIHDFFFLRGLNQLRPGGVMMALTSTGTMDKQDTQIRLAMAQQAELVGAIRLPNGMFSKSSGTNVACDLLVFRKREEPISRLKAAEEPWVQTQTMDDGNGKKVFVNNYFAENEGNIVGEMKVTSGQYGPTIKTTFSGTSEEMNAALNNVIKENFPKDIMGKTLTKEESEYTTADTSHANHTFYIKNDELMYRKDNAEINVAKDQPVESAKKRPDKLSKIASTKKAYDDFIARHPEYKALDSRDSELEGKKKPNNKGYSWQEKVENVASKNPALAKKAIDAAFKEQVALEKLEKTEKLIQQIKPLVKLNEKFQELTDAMTKGEDKKVIEKLRKEALDLFNKAVEATPNKKLAWEVTPVKKDGTPGKTRIEYDESLKILQNFGDGNAFTNICALDKGEGKPADILTGVELQSVAKVTEPSVQNSLQVQITDGAQTIDIDRIAKENNKPAKEVLEQLIKDDSVYETLDGDIVPHNVYLSGNVRRKLREAQAMARKDKKFQRNVDALKKVIPEDLTSSEIQATIGASWVPVKMYKAFFASMLGLSPETNDVTVTNDNGKWKVEISDTYDKSDRRRLDLAGDTRKSVSDVFNAAMNKRHLKVFDVDGQTHKQTLNEAATEAVEAKIKETNDKFLSWLWDENDERREEMEHKYNEEMNCTVNPQYNANFVKSYPGMVKTIKKGEGENATEKTFFPRDHQRNVVLKFLTEMRGIAAHDAGTGKTLIMAMLCMELRRTGKAKKPIIFAHNSNSAEIANNIKKYYPGSKVLYVKEFSKSANSDTTEILLSQMATGDWDAIVLPHSLMGRIAFTEQTALKLRQEEIDYWTQRAIAEANENNITLLDNDLNADDSHKYNSKTGDSQLDDEEKKRLGSVADYVRRIRTIKKKCKLMGQRLNSPGYIDFEKTGIDCCLIDEAHEFKKGPKDTSRTVKGLDTGVSEKGSYMDMLSKFINDKNGNKGVFEFTGTLITNTIPEIHTHMKYVMPDVLKQAGIYHLDDFLSTFTETLTDTEPNAAGEPEAVERLRKFTNIPELRNLAGQHIDIVTVKDLPEFSPRATESGKSIDDKTLTNEERTYLKNGYDSSAKPAGLPNHEVVNVTIPSTKRMDYIYKRVKEIANWIAKSTGVTKKEIFAKGIGLKFQSLVPGIGASIRNLYKDFEDLNTSKADMCVANIKKEYDDAAAQGRPCAQVIFMEKGYNDERTISEATGTPVKGGKWKKLFTDIYNVAGYNMAKDLQSKLIAAGFKPEEVAIAGGDDNKYGDPEDRKRLAEKVKNGEVKVVIAQYGTMGVGVNMQDNLRAIHHIDAPWMPGELEQENKRGIRQGNHWNTVREYRYISPGMDSKRWAALATKASFISAFMDKTSKVRTIESDALSEENSGTANDILNSLSESLGDTRYAQKDKAQGEIERLEKQRTNFETRRRKAKEDVKIYKKQIANLQNRVEHADVDSAVYAHDRDVHPDFSIQIRNVATGEFQTFTDKEKAQSFLDGNRTAAANSEYKDDFIRFRGFKIGIEKVSGGKDSLFSSYHELTARSVKPDFEAEAREAEEKAKIEAEKAAKNGKKEAKKKEAPKKEVTDLTKFNDADYGKGEYKTDNVTITSLQAVLSNIGNSKSRWEKALSKAEEDLVGHESQANAEWKDQPKLDAAKKKLKAIEDDLKENTVPAPEWFRTVAAVGNLVRYNDALYPIVGHSIPDGEKIKDYGIIVENPTVGNEERIRIPASEARDENGVLLFQPEDLMRDPRQRIVDEADDVNYTDDFEERVDTAFENILEHIEPENWEITSKGVRRKTTEAETGKQGIRWTEEIEGDEIVYSSPIKDGEPIGGANSFKTFSQRINKLEASVAESAEPQIKQSVDKLVEDVKTAFPGAKHFHRNGQHLMFIMPNGSSIAVDIANQVVLTGKDAEDARKAHGKNADEPIRVNGYAMTFGKDAAIKLAKDGDRGTVFHESYHVAHNLVLTPKEKAAMEKHFAPIAKEQGRAVTEVMADAYRDWQLARKQHKGTLFGKLFQKIQDFANKVLAILTGTENVHNVMRKIAQGEVWNRDAQRGRSTTDYLVTNPHLKADTKIPVLDFNGLKGINPDDINDRQKLQQALVKYLANKKFTLLNAPADMEVGFERLHKPDFDGVVRDANGDPVYLTDKSGNVVKDQYGNPRIKYKPAKNVNGVVHWLAGNRTSKYNTYLRSAPERLRATSDDAAIEKLLNGSVYVDVHQDVSHGGKRGHWVELYAAIRGGDNPNRVYRYRITAELTKQGDNMYQIKKVGLYDFFRQTDRTGTNNVANLVDKKTNTITAANLLKNVYDRYGNNYVDSKGNLVFDPNITPEAEPKVEASISSKIDEGLSKAEAYANRNMRTANEQTAEGRVGAKFRNTTNKNAAQSIIGWFKEQKKNFYRDYVDKNIAFKGVDKAIEAITGKKLAPNSSVYKAVQMMKALAMGSMTTLIEGDANSLNALRERIGSAWDTANDPEKAKRAKELKEKFNSTSMRDVMETINYKEMDKAHPEYLEKHGFNNWREAFGAYLGSRRLIELANLAEKNNIKDYKLPVSKKDMEAMVKNAPKEFAEAAKKYYQVQENMLVLLEDAGMLDKGRHDFMNENYHDYCPLMVDYSDTASLENVLNKFLKNESGPANVSTTLKYLLEEGSERKLISPLESTYKSIVMLTERAERNKVATKFVHSVMNDEDLAKTGLITKVEGVKSDDPKHSIFTVMENGQKVAYQTQPDLYGSIVAGNEEGANLAFKLAKNCARTLRAGATSSPSFIIRNFIRDTIFAGVSSRNGFVPVVDSLRGMKALFDPKLRGEYEAMGITVFNFYGSAESAVKSLDELAGGHVEIHSAWDVAKALLHMIRNVHSAKDAVNTALEIAGAASEFVENSTRMGEFMKARQNGKSLEEAALDAKEVTLDFSRSGRVGQQINQVVPFFNACIQGGDKMIRLLAEPETRFHTLRMIGMYIMLPSMLLWIWNKDEPWYEEIDPHIRMNNWILPGGVRIPKPQEAGVLFGSGLEAIMNGLTERDPKAWQNWRKAALDALFPNLIPTLFLPFMEWQANYSFFREKAIEGNRLKRLPVEQRYNNSTSEASKYVGKKAGLSPVKLDNTIRGYLGTMGMFAVQLFDYGFEEKRNLPAKQFKERAFIRDFVLNDMNMNRTSEDFYDLVSAAQQKHAGYGKKGRPTPATTAINKALRDVSLKNKEIQQITAQRNLTPERKRQLIDQKRKIIHQIQKATLNRYRSKYDI